MTRCAKLSGFVLACVLTCLSGCARKEPPTVRLQWTVMGTVAAVQCPSRSEAQRAKQICERIFSEQEEIFSVWREDSVISKVNRSAGGGVPLPVTGHFRKVLGCALEVHAKSDGAFNPLLAPLSKLWGFLGAKQISREPSQGAIDAALALTDCGDVQLDAAGCLLRKKGMTLDLGGIAKGYAVDVAYDALRGAGFSVFLIDLGGNIRVSGNPHSDQEGWRIGIRDPHSRHGVASVVCLNSGEATATSADYERFRIVDGKRYGHIVDARTGRPAQGRACTVKASSAMVADVLSTAVYVLDGRKSESLLKEYSATRLY